MRRTAAARRAAASPMSRASPLPRAVQHPRKIDCDDRPYAPPLGYMTRTIA